MEQQLIDLLGHLVDLSDKVGTLALALAIIFAFTTGRVVLGSRVAEADERADKRITNTATQASLADAAQATDYQRQLEWLDARRKEERDDRIAAEATMRKLVDKFDDIIVLVKRLGDEITRGRNA